MRQFQFRFIEEDGEKFASDVINIGEEPTEDFIHDIVEHVYALDGSIKEIRESRDLMEGREDVSTNKP